jgi:hypothetical protein
VFTNARSGQYRYLAYIAAVNDSHRTLKSAFIQPDLAAGLLTTAYWNLVQMGGPAPDEGVYYPDSSEAELRAVKVPNLALSTEIEHQVHVMEQAQVELKALVGLASRPGLPVVYDTNMLNHWQQPDGVKWRDVFRNLGENVQLTRLVVPLTVIDELDRQKYGPADGDLAKRATKAIRYLERTLKDSQAGRPVRLREDATLEVWGGTEDRSGDADLAILRCAADLDSLHPGVGTRVLTGDFGMRLRAQQMRLKVMSLPAEYRKPGTAVADAAAANGH